MIHPGWQYDEPGVAFPATHRISPAVPRELQREWNEARACLEARAYTACLVMVRRTLEGACLDQGVKKNRLVDSLKELKTTGVIDGMLAEWADALRIAGNRGAHFTGEPVSREDAQDALAFAEALLDHIYVLRKRFKDLKSRLDTKGSPAHSARGGGRHRPRAGAGSPLRSNRGRQSSCLPCVCERPGVCRGAPAPDEHLTDRLVAATSSCIGVSPIKVGSAR